jgi:hypothetical protein|tara:strand:- start:2259 stop:2561 length:303 start_codon:yes stop_codon:yes gene_type:complete
MPRAFLGFVKDADDGAYVSVEKIHHIEVISATAVDVHFAGDDGGAGSVELTCTSGKADDVAKEVARIAATASGVITIADGLNSAFAHPDITAVANYNKSA